MVQLLTDAAGTTEEIPLVSAPAQAFAGDFDRGWLLAVQLYGVRSTRNWGMGDFTDLADLIDPAPPPSTMVATTTIVGGGWLRTRYFHRRYLPRRRVTILASPGFYRRARGGFGGPHARPSHIHFGRGFHGPSHGGG